MLKNIVASTRNRVEQKKKLISFNQIKKKAWQMTSQQIISKQKFPFEHALKTKEISFICEIKKASPSKGLINAEFNYIDIANEYQQAGAAAISVVTEPEFFMGDDKYLYEIQKEVSIPVLRKDFIVDEYQIYQAKVLGASAVLLICSLADTQTLRKYISICDQLNLSALVEAHNQAEIMSALKAGARIIGVNNRNLNDFTVDIQNSISLRKLVPENILFVAESGIKTRSDVEMLENANVNAVLIGETLMKSLDRQKTIKKLRGVDIDQN